MASNIQEQDDCEMTFEALSSSGEDEGLEEGEESLVDNRLLQKTMKQIFDKQKSEIITKGTARDSEVKESPSKARIGRKPGAAGEKRKKKSSVETSSSESETSPKKSKTVITITNSDKSTSIEIKMDSDTTSSSKVRKDASPSATASGFTPAAEGGENSNESLQSRSTEYSTKVVGEITELQGEDAQLMEHLGSSAAALDEDLVERQNSGIDSESVSPSEVKEETPSSETKVKVSKKKKVKPGGFPKVTKTIVMQELEVSPPTPVGKTRKPRFKRCKQCQNCRRPLKESCGLCAPCQNKHWKKPCVLRECVNKSKQTRRKPTPVERSTPVKQKKPTPVEKSTPVKQKKPTPVEKSTPVKQKKPTLVERITPVKQKKPPLVERSTPVKQMEVKEEEDVTMEPQVVMVNKGKAAEKYVMGGKQLQVKSDRMETETRLKVKPKLTPDSPVKRSNQPGTLQTPVKDEPQSPDKDTDDGDVEITGVTLKKKTSPLKKKAASAEEHAMLSQQPGVEVLSVEKPVLVTSLSKKTDPKKPSSLFCNICYTTMKNKDVLISHLYDHFADERAKEKANKKTKELKESAVGNQSQSPADSKKKPLLVHKFRKGNSASLSQAPAGQLPNLPRTQTLSEDDGTANKPRKVVSKKKQSGLYFEASSSDEEGDTLKQHKQSDKSMLKCPHCRLVAKSHPGLRAHLLIYHPNQPSTANTQQTVFPSMSPSLSPARTGPILSPSQARLLSSKNSPIITHSKKLNFDERSPGRNIGHSVVFIDSQGKSVNLISGNNQKSSSGISNDDDDCKITKLTPAPVTWVEKEIGDDNESTNQNTDNKADNAGGKVVVDDDHGNKYSKDNDDEDVTDKNDTTEDKTESSEDKTERINIKIIHNKNSSSPSSSGKPESIDAESKKDDEDDSSDNGKESPENKSKEAEIRLYV